MSKTQTKRIIKLVACGIIISVIIFGLIIMIGYFQAYRVKTPTYSISVFGNEIYQLTLNGEKYSGVANNGSMSLLAMVFTIFFTIAAEFICLYKERKKAKQEPKNDQAGNIASDDSFKRH